MEKGREGEWELRGHKTSVPNNSSTDVAVPAKEMMKVFPGGHTQVSQQQLWVIPPAPRITSQ